MKKIMNISKEQYEMLIANNNQLLTSIEQSTDTCIILPPRCVQNCEEEKKERRKITHFILIFRINATLDRVPIIIKGRKEGVEVTQDFLKGTYVEEKLKELKKHFANFWCRLQNDSKWRKNRKD